MDSLVCYGSDITDAESAYRLLNETESKIRLFYVPEILENVNIQLHPVPGTMALHQLRNSQSENKIIYRTLSCFCNKVLNPGYCHCLDIKEHNLTIIQNQTILKNLKRQNNFKDSIDRKKNRKEISNLKKMKTSQNRSRHLKKFKVQPDDTDTSTDSEVTYAESDDSLWEGEENIDSDALDPEEMKVLTKNYKMEDKETDKIAAPTSKVTILSDIRITPENQAHIDLHNYFSRGKIVDKHFNLFSTLRVSDKENTINIYDDPIPSTSGKCNLKQNNKMMKVKQEIQNIETNYDIMQQ